MVDFLAERNVLSESTNSVCVCVCVCVCVGGVSYAIFLALLVVLVLLVVVFAVCPICDAITIRVDHHGTRILTY